MHPRVLLLLSLADSLRTGLALPQGNGDLSQDGTVLRDVSILSMIGSDPIVVQTYNVSDEVYSVPIGPEVNGTLAERAPGSPSFPYGCNTGNLCDCQPKRFKSIRWVTQTSKKIAGSVHRISDALCPPGTITKSYSYSYTYQISVQAGPDLKVPFINNVDKFGIRVGFSYTWGRAQTTAYTVQCNDPANGHPCVEIFTPYIGVLTGIAYETVEVPGNQICSRGPDSHMEIHVPVVDSSDCSGSHSSCGASGVYDSCYYVGDLAKKSCPRSHLGPTPQQHVCPAGLDK